MVVFVSSSNFGSYHHILSFRSSNIIPNRVNKMKVMSSSNPAPAAFLAAVVLLTSSAAVSPDETFSNVPQTLSGDDKKKARIQKPRSRKAESCTSKCVGSCILGGAGSPGEGPLNSWGPLIVFKDGFRSRQYCLAECSEICNLIKDTDE